MYIAKNPNELYGSAFSPVLKCSISSKQYTIIQKIKKINNFSCSLLLLKYFSNFPPKFVSFHIFLLLFSHVQIVNFFTVINYICIICYVNSLPIHFNVDKKSSFFMFTISSRRFSFSSLLFDFSCGKRCFSCFFFGNKETKKIKYNSWWSHFIN